MRRASAVLTSVLVLGTTGLRPVSATTSLAWQRCAHAPAPYECARIPVPNDYRRPSSGQRTLSVIRLPARDPASRVGTLVVNPGGPGNSGVRYLPIAAGGQLSTVAERFDLVSFDPRGVGESGPVRCIDDGSRDAAAVRTNPFPTLRDLPGLVQHAVRTAAGCAYESGGDLPLLTTAYAARDLDTIRSALGAEQISYLGFSYGTYLGATYSSLFPHRLRAMALDGAVDPVQTARDPLGKDIEQARGFENGLRRFFHHCDETPAECSLTGDAERRFHGLLATVRRKPLAAPSGDPARPVNAYVLVTGVQAALYARQSWPFLGLALAQAEAGDGSLLQLASDVFRGRSADGSYEQWPDAFLAITAADRDYPSSVAAFVLAAQRAAATAPTFGPLNVYSSLPAGLLRVNPAEDFEGPFTWQSSGPPALVIGTLHDTATPYRGAKAMTVQLGQAVLLSFDGDGHTAYGRGSACVDRAVTAYLIDLAIPAPNTMCGYDSPVVASFSSFAGR